MSIKNNNPENSIIVEGLWNVGKTSIARSYCEKFGYTLLSEPMHTHQDEVPAIKDIDLWYIDQHKKRADLLQDSKKVFSERSILSSFAFLYALDRPLPDKNLINYLRDIIQKNTILIVYIRSEKLVVSKKDINSKVYSEDIQNILENPKASLRYENWYNDILPREYGISPLVVNVTGQEGISRSVTDMANEINLVLKCNRIAQINVVCFARSKSNADDLQILVLKRNQQKGGFWQTITGGVHIGENLYNAAKREVMEEIGLFDDVSLFPTRLSYSFMGDDGYMLKEYVFGCEVSDPSKIQISEEHDSFEWMHPQKAVDRVAYENNKQAINSVIKNR
jgi:8-oxo-dGTP pyrophosphatase MutT (NUDIX family)